MAFIRAVIRGVGAYLPKKVLSNHDLSRLVDTSDDWIRERTGIEQRHIAADDELTSDLGIAAARQVLATASARKLEASDVAPLFEVLQKYGGPAVITELEQAAKHWSYYGTIALAQLPDGAGIPGLISITQDPKTANGAREAAFQMLAQVFPQSPEARAVLLQQARSGAISDYAWRIMAPVLAGDQVGLLNSAFEDHQGLTGARGLRTTRTSDNQSYFVLPSNLTPDQVAERTALIDELLVATTDATAREVLEQSKNRLTTQQPSAVAVSR